MQARIHATLWPVGMQPILYVLSTSVASRHCQPRQPSATARALASSAQLKAHLGTSSIGALAGLVTTPTVLDAPRSALTWVRQGAHWTKLQARPVAAAAAAAVAAVQAPGTVVAANTPSCTPAEDRSVSLPTLMAFLGLRRWLVARREMYFSSKAGIGAGSSGSGRHERRQRQRSAAAAASHVTHAPRALGGLVEIRRVGAKLCWVHRCWVGGTGVGVWTGGDWGCLLGCLGCECCAKRDEGFQGAKGSMPALRASHCMRLLLRVCPSQAPGDALQHGDWSKSCPGS